MLGVEPARKQQVRTADTVTRVAPGVQVTPAGTVARLKRFTDGGLDVTVLPRALVTRPVCWPASLLATWTRAAGTQCSS